MSGSTQPGAATTRDFEMTIDLDAPPDAVWAALTTAEGLRRWFPIDARVTPGEGGRVWLSWGPGMEGEAPITIWDPPRRFRWEEKRAKEGDWPTLLCVDFVIEPRRGGAGTTLRLVNSGYGRDASWDDQFDSISNGWNFELRSLRHALLRHPGRDRRCLFICSHADGAPERAWRMMMGDGGPFAGAGAVAEGLREGDAYAFAWSAGAPAGVLAAGREARGRVVLCTPGRVFAATLESLGGALLRIEVERSTGKAMPFLWVSLWERSDLTAEVRGWFEGMMARLFGAADVRPRT